MYVPISIKHKRFMFEVEKTFYFEAGHQLIHHDGKCKEPHGHSYVLTVTLRKAQLIESGAKKNMLLDFSEISALLHPMIEKYFDHKWLNDTLATDSPTVEYIAKWIFDYLKPFLPDLEVITLHETATCKARYSEK